MIGDFGVELGGFGSAERSKMSSKAELKEAPKRAKFSVDWWAVTLALLAALLVRIGVIGHVPW
jgi:hypothetical protein